MKKIGLLTSILLLLVACNEENQYKIHGVINNAKNQILYLDQLELNSSIAIDSTELGGNGKFSFKGEKLKEPTFFRLRLNHNNYISLLVDSCASIEIIADGNNMDGDYTVKNSLESNQIKVLNRRLRTTKSAIDSLSVLYKKLKNRAQKRIIQNEYLSTIDDHKKFIGSFVMENPQSFASYYALFQKLDNDNYIMNVMDRSDQVFYATVATSLNILYPESEKVKHLYSYVLSAKKTQRKLEKAQKLMSMATSNLPDIEEKTPAGDSIKLSSLKGKYVLLSFWASWNKQSRNENKNLVSVYKKFQTKGFEIYQVSLDQSKILWELAIEEDGCNWINVSDLRFTESYPARIYNIRDLPANFLINPEGEIIGKDLFGYRLEDKLNDLLEN